MKGEFYLKEIFQSYGRLLAREFQKTSRDLSNTEINTEIGIIPNFSEAKKTMNMLQRPIGFLCVSPMGRIVKLIQNYDSDIYPDMPEELAAQWGFVWSKNPKHAKPFISLATSPYNTGDCCTFGSNVYQSLVDGNVFPPNEYPAGWRIIEENNIERMN